MCRFICSFQCEVLSFCIFVSSSTEQMFGSVEKICQVAVAGGGSGDFLFPNNNNNNTKHCERLEMARKYGCVGKTNTHFEIAFVETFGSTTSMENAYFSSFFSSLSLFPFKAVAFCSLLYALYSRHLPARLPFFLASYFALQCFYYVWQICFLLLLTFLRSSLHIYFSFIHFFHSLHHFHLISCVYVFSTAQHHHANAFLVQFRSLFTFAFVFPQPTLFSPACFAFFI